MTLRRYILKRIVVSIFVLWVVATLFFLVFFRTDPFASHPLAGIYEIPAKDKEMLLQTYGPSGLLFFRYIFHLRKMFTYGLVYPYFGYSVLDKNFIAYGMSRRLPTTLFLIGTSLTSSIILGIFIGMFTASKQGTKKDMIITASSLFTWATPVFSMQFLAVFIFSYLLVRHGIYILPLNSVLPVPRPTGLALYAAIAWHMTLPIITLTLVGVGSWVIYTRNLLVDTLTQDYITTARAKGLSERAVVYRHAFKSVLPPIATMISLTIPTLITGSIATEIIFRIDGIGSYFIRAFMVQGEIVFILDHAVVQAVFFIYATIAVVLNLIADLIYGVFDPRIRVGTRK